MLPNERTSSLKCDTKVLFSDERTEVSSEHKMFDVVFVGERLLLLLFCLHNYNNSFLDVLQFN